MVYAANGGLIVNGNAVVARFAYAERADESVAHADWMVRNGYLPAETRHVNEGQGDLLVVGSIDPGRLRFPHRPARTRRGRRPLGMPVIGLELVDPRFYHLDTALAVLDDDHDRVLPAGVRQALPARGCAELFPDAIEVASADAYVSGSTPSPTAATSSCPRPPPASPSSSGSAGFQPVGVDLSELLKGGGSVKCCTLEVHP